MLAALAHPAAAGNMKLVLEKGLHCTSGEAVHISLAYMRLFWRGLGGGK
jgi:hypothetical protein